MLALAVLVGPAEAQATQASDVALFELTTPDVVDFTLHGTIPVPKGTFPRADGLMPFSVRDVDGTLVPAQVEAVTWYPDKAKHGADVVEVIAQVERPAAYTNHDQVFYEVVAAPVAPGAPSMTPTIQAFLAVRDSLVLKTRDAFGNVYDLDLRKGKYGVKTLKSGRWQTQTRYYGVMKPDKKISGPNGTLHHLFGVHAYVTTYAGEDFVQLDLRVHNGMSGLDQQDPFDDPNDKIYFDSLDLVVPEGWTVIQDFSDPMLGAPIYKQRYTTFPLVEPNADGTLHVFPQQSQMHRRLVVTPLGNETRAMSALREQWLAFVRMGTNTVTAKNLYSWWAPSTSRYFPQKTTMPDLAHIGAANCRSELTSNMNFYAGYMASGQSMNAYPLHSPRLGWAHPWGTKYGGMTSGQEIYLYDGMTVAWGASSQGYRLAQLQHRMYSDRHPTVIYNKNGEPTQVSDWLEGPAGSQYVYMNFYMRLLPGSNDPFGFTQAPVWQINHVKANNLDPTYESDLLAHENIDMQHLIRYTHAPKVLMWIGNDALAKDDLRMQAEIVRLSYHPYYVSPNQATIVSGMLEDIQFVAANPNIGFPFGRGEGWAADTMATAYAMADNPWRAAAVPWFDELTDLVWSGQSACNGFIQAQVGSKLLNGNYRARQSIEQAMIENALFGVNETVYRDVNSGNSDRLESVTLASVYAMIGSLAWDPINDGPHSTLAVGPLNLGLPLFCTLASFPPVGGTSGGIDAYQTWSSFAYGYQLSGDEEFLSKGFDMTGGGSSSLNKSLESTNFNNLENRYALLAMSQRHDYP